MRAAGVNAIRTYTMPPRWFLDLALEHDVRVMAGMPWEEHVAFLDDRAAARRSSAGCVTPRARSRDTLRSSATPIGNEIPASMVRWHGPRRIEEFLRRLVDAAKEEDPDGLVTYVNYPTTEYLQLPFLDFVSLQRLPRVGGALARVPRSAAEHCGRPATASWRNRA